MPSNAPDALRVLQDEERRFLVVEDDAPLARRVARVLTQFAPVAFARTVAEAMGALGQHRHWAGFVVDVGLPDGSGLDVVEEARGRFPHVGRLVLTGNVAPDVIHATAGLGALFLSKPFTPEVLVRFCEGCLESVGGSPAPEERRRREVLSAEAERLDLTLRETQVLGARLAGFDADTACLHLEMTRSTYGHHTSSILKKAGDKSMEAVVTRLLREALDCSRCGR